MINGIILGLTSYFKAFPAVVKYKLWTHLLSLGALSLGVGYLIFRVIWKQSDRLGDWATGWYKWERGSSFIGSLSDWLVWLVLMVGAIFLYKYIIQIIAAPIMSSMSAKMIRKMDRVGGIQEMGMIKSTLRGLRISVGNLSKEMVLTILLLLVSFIPVIGFISTALIFIVSAYFAGFGNIDYFMEHQFNVKESKGFVKRNRGLAIANGAIFVALLSIPVLGWFLAPALGGIAATLAASQKLD